ncbi:MAG TPA: hypothetical protein PLV70_06975 [Flavobacteriales bacterium]|nr:hypothetical protein [Flavobacteriales bacterium]HRO38645.1 hypothetical protein [Flavobacteriales bacterium]HRP80994.1 hypothetical protein [Flavobacteriales bacterium]HRQ84840.1 hypothetical protein [Flavobacteriales bacterium]
MTTRRIFLLLAALSILLLPADLWAQGCAMCKAVAASEGDKHVFGGSQAIGAGLNRGILFIMAIPYILLFLFFRKKISSFIREFRNAQG